jgi:hypothetical protein
MPKLTISQRTFGKAIAALLKLYKAEPDFARELEELRITYSPVLDQWLKIGVPNWIQMQKTLTQEELSITRNFFLTANQTISDSLADKLEPFLSIPDPHLAGQLEAYVESLTDLAYRWRLKAPWAGRVLLVDHILDMMPKDARNAEISVEMLEPFLPSAPLPPLQFEVNAYELMFSGRQEIRDKFAKALADYENKLKSLGWQEIPTAIENHARWWFEHYVHQKTYDEIAQLEIHTPGGSLISYARNVGTAVRNFARLMGIEAVNVR